MYLRLIQLFCLMQCYLQVSIDWKSFNHKSIKSSSDKVRCVFFNCLLLNLDFIYAACLEIKKQKEEFKKKQPKQSALYKQCIVLFSFPSCHITAQLYLLGCLFSIAKQKGLRGSVPLVTCAWEQYTYQCNNSGVMEVLRCLNS